MTGWSTLARELAFVVSHTIHHQAIIGVLLAIHGHAVPDGLVTRRQRRGGTEKSLSRCAP